MQTAAAHDFRDVHRQILHGFLSTTKDRASLWTGHRCSLQAGWLWLLLLWTDVPSQRGRHRPGAAAEQVGWRSVGPLLSAERLEREGRSVGRSAVTPVRSESGSALGKRRGSKQQSGGGGGGGFRGEWTLDDDQRPVPVSSVESRKYGQGPYPAGQAVQAQANRANHTTPIKRQKLAASSGCYRWHDSAE